MTIIEKYKLAIFVLVLIISALLIANGILVLKLRGKDLDGKIARGRRTQRRMEQHPKRTYETICDAERASTCSLDELAAAIQSVSESAGRSWCGGPK